jgi:hypothetical protein
MCILLQEYMTEKVSIRHENKEDAEIASEIQHNCLSDFALQY